MVRWSLVTGHRSMVFRGAGQGLLVKGCWSLVIGHWPAVMFHLSLVTCHESCIGLGSFVIGHLSLGVLACWSRAMVLCHWC